MKSKPIIALLALLCCFFLQGCVLILELSCGEENDFCPSGTYCNAGVCVESRVESDGVGDRESCECSEGPCCDGCNYLTIESRCSEEAISFEYSCGEGECGADIMRKGIYRHCSGVSSDCPDNVLREGTWRLVSDCTETQVCTIVNGQIPFCSDCDYGCHEGECINCNQSSDGECADVCTVLNDIDCCNATSCSMHSDGCCPSSCFVANDVDCSCESGCPSGTCSQGEWAFICAGTFVMGSPVEELGREICWDEEGSERQHRVTLTRNFEILSTEVTLSEFTSLMGYTPDSHTTCTDENCPVNMVNWHESAAYCNALSIAADLDECYTCSRDYSEVICSLNPVYSSPYDCPGYRLPTEAEWEYAARAGTVTATYNGDLEIADEEDCYTSSIILGTIAWYCVNSDDSQRVGRLEPNDWGLYDMLGNVSEWCHDWYVRDLGSADVTDPWGTREHATGNLRRTDRGGGADCPSPFVRAAYRSPIEPDSRYPSTGFRPVRTLP